MIRGLGRLRRAGRALTLLASAALLCGFDFFRSENGDVRDGNQQLSGGKPEEALKSYNRAAKALPEEKGVHYNRGVALYKLGKFEEARKALLEATGAQDRALRQQAFYNLGNAQYQAKQYRDAADAYRRALRLDPADRAAKWNLELALRQIREEEKKKKEQQKKNDKDKQQQDKKQQDKKQQDKEQQDKEQQDKEQQDKQQDKQQQDKKQQDKEQQDKKQQDKKQQQSQQPQDKQQQQQPPRPQPRPEEQRMQRALDALDRGDKDLQRRRLRLLYGGHHRPTKDW